MKEGGAEKGVVGDFVGVRESVPIGSAPFGSVRCVASVTGHKNWRCVTRR